METSKRVRSFWVLAVLWLTPLIAEDLASGFRFTSLRTGRAFDPGPVTAETVTGFEVLYATSGTGDIAEIAGHLLLRVKLTPGPEGESRDLVVSFLAATPQMPPSWIPSEKAPDCREDNWWNLVQAPEGSPQNLHSHRYGSRFAVSPVAIR